MTLMRTTTLLTLITLITLAGTACETNAPANAGRDTAARSHDADSGATAAMPEMADMAAKDKNADDAVTLSAAQIASGRVQWEAAVMGAAAAVAAVPGQLLPNEDRTARLGAPASGRVIAVRVRPGDRVARGQALVTLQSPEAGMAQSDLAKGEAEVVGRRAQAVYARSARDRAERLLALKAIPRQDYERAVADDELARQALVQAEAELRRARGSAEQLGASASGAGEIVLRSPLAGVVLERSALPGSVVDAGASLVVVTDPSTLWLSIDAPESLSGFVRVGGTVRFTVPAYGAESFVARIDAVGAGLSADRRTLPVRAVVPNGSRRLKPQMLANASVERADSVQAIVLPDDAVQLMDTRTVVFIARPDSGGRARFVARAVEVGARAAGRVSLRRGVAAGELVVTRGAFAVKAQLKKGSMPDMEM